MGIKFSIRQEGWEIEPQKFLTGFSNPSNPEHQLWAALRKLSLIRGEDPLRVTVSELEVESELEKTEIEKLLEVSELNGCARRKFYE